MKNEQDQNKSFGLKRICGSGMANKKQRSERHQLGKVRTAPFNSAYVSIESKRYRHLRWIQLSRQIDSLRSYVVKCFVFNKNTSPSTSTSTHTSTNYQPKKKTCLSADQIKNNNNLLVFSHEEDSDACCTHAIRLVAWNN